jgi:hypothetical protein
MVHDATKQFHCQRADIPGVLFAPYAQAYCYPGESTVWCVSGSNCHQIRCPVSARASFTCRIIGAEGDNRQCSASIVNPMRKSIRPCSP